MATENTCWEGNNPRPQWNSVCGIQICSYYKNIRLHCARPPHAVTPTWRLGKDLLVKMVQLLTLFPWWEDFVELLIMPI